MKRSIIFFLLIAAITTLSLIHLQSDAKTKDLNEIKCRIYYNPVSGWTMTAFIGTTSYGSCGPTNSGGACSIEGLPSGTYTIKATRNGCTGTLYNVYHPGSGQTYADFGPSIPDQICE